MTRQKQESNKTRGFCFTINNYIPGTDVALEQMFRNNSIRYMVFAFEVGEKSHIPHIQGYVYFKNPRSIKNIQSEKGIFKGLGAAIKVANGDAEDNRKYIIGPYEKEGKIKPYNPDHKEFGDMPEQGKRNDLAQVTADIMAGGTNVDSILESDPMFYHQYGRTLNAIEDLALLRRHRSWMTKGLWLWGKTGVGKSHTALQGYCYKTHYMHNLNDNGWWDGYKGQEIVILNEFRGQITFSELLDLCDWVPKTVKRRNRQPVPFLAKLIIITSSKPPEEVYHKIFDDDQTHEGFDQLKRRFVVEQMCSRGNIDLSRYLMTHDEEKEILEEHKKLEFQEYEEF